MKRTQLENFPTPLPAARATREPLEMMLSLPLVFDERELVRFAPFTTSVFLSIASQ